jgi:hypothetical protein
MFPSQKMTNVVQIQPQLQRQDTKRIRIKYGPYKISPSNVRLQLFSFKSPENRIF